MASTSGIVAVPQKKVIAYGANVSVTQERLALDVTNWTRNQVIELLRSTAAEETAQQIRLGNPPDVVISDNTRGKPASTAIKRIEVGFGTRLKPAALSALKSILKHAIEKATQRRTGTLANVDANWTYLYIRGGRAMALPLGNREGIPLSGADAIVLRPKAVPHATVANIRATQGRRAQLNAKRAAKGRGPSKKGGQGFMAQATAAARRSPIFAGFNVAVRWTDYTVPGEKWKRGMTATIMITLKEGRRQMTRSRRR